MSYPHLLIKVLQLLVDKLAAVIGDNRVGKAEATNDISPDEGMDLPSGYVG